MNRPPRDTANLMPAVRLGPKRRFRYQSCTSSRRHGRRRGSFDLDASRCERL